MEQPSGISKRGTTRWSRQAHSERVLEERQARDQAVATEEARMRAEAQLTTAIPKLTPAQIRLRNLISSRSAHARARLAREQVDPAYAQKRAAMRRNGKAYRMPWASDLSEQSLVARNLIEEQRDALARRTRSTRPADVMPQSVGQLAATEHGVEDGEGDRRSEK